MAQTHKSRRAKLARMQKQCDDWNASNPVGSEVLIKLDGRDEPELTTTRSTAQILSGHSPVIWLTDVSGCYLLDRVRTAGSGAERPQVAAELKRKFA
jgi:hypothetical protein